VTALEASPVAPVTAGVEAGAAAPALARRPPAGRGRARLRRGLAVVAPSVVAFAILLAVWYLLAGRLSPERKFLLPTPDQVLTRGIFDHQAFTETMDSMWLTTKLALSGLAVAIVLGTLLAVAMYQVKSLERAFYPYLVALQAVPILAIAPLMTVAFGYGFWSKAIVCVIIAFFPIATNTLLGLKSVDPGMRDLFTLQDAGWFTRLRKLALPSAMPAVFAGLRISAGLAVIGAIVGEQFFQKGDPGLGQRLVQYRVRLQYPQLYSCLIWSSLLGIAVFLVFGRLSNLALRSWHESARTDD
jgi:NitT/TauT family transport system permease protein